MIFTVCEVCRQSQFFVELSCGCSSYCQDCILQWTREQLKSLHLKEETALLCPRGDSRHELSLEEVQEVAKGSEWEDEIAQAALRNSLRNMTDMVFCPMSGCDCIGWVDATQQCCDPVECESCGSHWKEEQLFPFFLRYSRLLYRLVTLQDEWYNYVWRFVWTISCPCCSIPIENEGGCYNLTCPRCEFDFCWSCMQTSHYFDTRCFLSTVVRRRLVAGLWVMLELKALSVCRVANVLVWWLLRALFAGVQAAIFLIGLYLLMQNMRLSCWSYFCMFAVYFGFRYALIALWDVAEDSLVVEASIYIALVHCLVAVAFIKYDN